jgi:tetratricopeptide (TPR) repeat protein
MNRKKNKPLPDTSSSSSWESYGDEEGSDSGPRPFDPAEREIIEQLAKVVARSFSGGGGGKGSRKEKDSNESQRLRKQRTIERHLEATDRLSVRDDLDEIIEHQYKIVQALKEEAELESDPDPVPRASALLALSSNLLRKDDLTEGKLKEVEGMLVQALEIHSKDAEVERTIVACNYEKLAEAQYELGRFKDAEANIREAARIYAEALPAGDESLTEAKVLLAKTLMSQEREQEAVRLMRDTVAELKELYIDGHVDIAKCLHQLAFLLGRDPEAEALHREGLEICLGEFPNGHFLVSTSRYFLGGHLTRIGKHEEAVVLLEKVLRDPGAASLGFDVRGTLDSARAALGLGPGPRKVRPLQPQPAPRVEATVRPEISELERERLEKELLGEEEEEAGNKKGKKKKAGKK